jgi:hypothetical protein
MVERMDTHSPIPQLASISKRIAPERVGGNRSLVSIQKANGAREAIDGGERVSNGPHLLSGWKEIANYMHQGVRTVQRWELIGLPVRRVNTGRRSPVIALTEDLDAWARSLHVPLLDRIEELRATISSLESQIRSLKRQLRARNLPADMESAQTSNVTENESKSNAEEVSLSLD